MSRNSKSKAISWAQAVSKSREEKFMRKKKKCDKNLGGESETVN